MHSRHTEWPGESDAVCSKRQLQLFYLIIGLGGELCPLCAATAAADAVCHSLIE